MNSGIYYLIARNNETNEKIRIELTDQQDNRYCSTLSYIDTLTTKFVNKEQLIERLFKNNYINFKNADIYIEYSHNGLRFEEVIYKKEAGLIRMLESESTLDRNNIIFKNGFNLFISELNKRNVRTYVLNSSKINAKIKEHIELYYKNQFVREGNFFLQKIQDDLTIYKTYRDLYFVIDEFYHIEQRRMMEDRNNQRVNAKLVTYTPVIEQPNEEKQLEFNIVNNEIQLPNQSMPIQQSVESVQPAVSQQPSIQQVQTNPNRVVSDEVLSQVIKEHNEEQEEFLTQDDWNGNYYPYNVKK